MASDVIGLNQEVFSSSNEIKFSDHLLENNILDEPLYENGEIIKKIFQANNKLSKSLMRIHEANISPSKDENIYENITYRENKLNSINESKSLKPLPRSKSLRSEGKADDKSNSSFNIQSNGPNEDSLTGIKGLYTSTFSLTIGKPMTPTIAELPEEKELNLNISDSTNNSQNGRSSEGSDNETFKSSYAKSLLDSFRKNTPNSSSAIVNQNSSQQSSVIQQEIKTPSLSPSSEKQLNSIQMAPKVFKPILNSECPSKSIERLENRVSSLTDNILLKDKELEKLRQEVMFLKLECNRVKAENRSLKASLNNSGLGPSSRAYINGDTSSHIPHSPISSISGDSDTWTLQQQVASLNSQLEKAELSRHAYEAATKQLVHFLQTINSTLTTVGGGGSTSGGSSDSKMQSPFTAQNTSELLTNLESTLLENRSRLSAPVKIKTNPYFENSRDGGSYLATKVDVHTPSPPTTEFGRSSEVDRLTRIKNEANGNQDPKTKDISNHQEDIEDHYVAATSRNTSSYQSTATIGNTSSSRNTSNYLSPTTLMNSSTSRNTNSYQSPNLNLISSSISEDSETHVHIKEAVVHKIKSPSADGKEEKKRSNPQRRFSISQKLFHSTKRPLVRSGSVNNLPTDLAPVPRVSRAVSTHCVALGKIEAVPSEAENDFTEQHSGSNSNSNRMKTSRAKDFFSSLKNLFKPDERSCQENSKKKSCVPSTQKSNKVKNDCAAPLSLHLNVPPSSASTNLKKRHSMKTPLSVARMSPLDQGDATLTTNSTFYVPCQRTSTPDGGARTYVTYHNDHEGVRTATPDGGRTFTPDEVRTSTPDGTRTSDGVRTSTPDGANFSNSSSVTSSIELNQAVADTPSDTDVEMSGPRELSLSLPRGEAHEKIPVPESPEKEESPPPSSLGAPFNCYITGGGPPCTSHTGTGIDQRGPTHRRTGTDQKSTRDKSSDTDQRGPTDTGFVTDQRGPTDSGSCTDQKVSCTDQKSTTGTDYKGLTDTNSCTDQREYPGLPDSWVINGEGIHVERYRRVDEIKSLELDDNYKICTKKLLPRVESLKEVMSTGQGGRAHGSRGRGGIRRYRSDIDAIGLKLSLWKLSRESYRSKECRLAFV